MSRCLQEWTTESPGPPPSSESWVRPPENRWCDRTISPRLPRRPVLRQSPTSVGPRTPNLGPGHEGQNRLSNDGRCAHHSLLFWLVLDTRGPVVRHVLVPGLLVPFTQFGVKVGPVEGPPWKTQWVPLLVFVSSREDDVTSPLPSWRVADPVAPSVASTPCPPGAPDAWSRHTGVEYRHDTKRVHSKVLRGLPFAGDTSTPQLPRWDLGVLCPVGDRPLWRPSYTL